MKMIWASVLALVLPSAAIAQDQPGKSGDSPPPLCTDRPGKATAACTVPQGMVQFESDFVNWTRDDDAGTRTDTILYTSPMVKYGLTGSTDIEAAITPFETVRTRDPSGTVERASGIGDVYLRVKQRLTPADAKAQFALIPYVKLPTAKSSIGNGKVEAGLVGTGVFTLPAEFSLTITPEVDALANEDLDGHHVQIAGALNLSKSLTSKLTASAELWGADDRDPAGHKHQYSADLALAYQPSDTLQFDGGANIGLNRTTPDLQVYAGVSTRF